ncbi:MAG: preprotein translocase subunit SecA [Clostridia bacterium]|nr:preprotein translocase subunit SecA [Clostridia bacterium]
MLGVQMGIFASANTISLKKLKKIADKVIEKENIYKEMSEEELKEMTPKLKERLKNGETLDNILPDAYAVVREVASRVLNMRHFYVQILGGIALHQGRISEMGTGEGKTLVATLPAYLNALTGKGVHVVTVNEYLAYRDSEWMGKIYRFLNLSVGFVSTDMESEAKHKAYNADITYATNNALGFDYLRDNMVIRASDRFQRGYEFAIVDEVDSILIDEARNPLIISGQGIKSSDTYYTAQKFVKTLKQDEDYKIQIREKTIHLTEEGISKAERFFKVDNLSDINCIEINHHIMNALRANFIMRRDENYVVKDDDIVIVDEFTGRLMLNRRYPEGLHQAVEAKEGVKIKNENKTLATITFQNYFRLYKKLSGMTGTAKTEESEFNGIYKLDVVQIPPNKLNRRIDEPDIVYTTVAGKNKAIAEEVEEQHKTGRPILIGTITIEKSEALSEALRRKKIRHVVLNAKNHEQESEIVAQAGRKGAVTIATNMAGRGTDILLGGNPEFLAKKKMRDENFTDEQISYATSFVDLENEEFQLARETYAKYFKNFKEITDKEKEEVISFGGLHIIGTERHESRRIDNQLRGRCARQGDPGSSIFFVSLEDDLMKRFAGDWLQKVASFLRVAEDTPLQMRMLSKQIEKAQKRIENQNYAYRRSTIQFDDVMSKQREIIYKERNKVLDGIDVHQQILEMFPDYVSRLVKTYLDTNKSYFEWNLEPLNLALEDKLFPKGTNLITQEFVDDCDVKDVIDKILNVIYTKYEEREVEAERYNLNIKDMEKHILLTMVDDLWMTHIDQMNVLKNEIGLRQYGNQDPIVAYKNEGFDLFDKMVELICENTCSFVLNFQIKIEPRTPSYTQQYTPINVVEGGEKEPVKSTKVVGRNSPCSCGSGKKFKNCCGK